MKKDITIDLNALNIVSRKKLGIFVKKIIIMLGSNDNADNNLDHAISYLEELGDCILSERIVSADYTGISSDYSNQAVLCSLYQNASIKDLTLILKNIEKQAGRSLNNLKNVPLDLDILLYYQDEWCIIQERYPFKLHEINVLLTMGIISD